MHAAEGQWWAASGWRACTADGPAGRCGRLPCPPARRPSAPACIRPPAWLVGSLLQPMLAGDASAAALQRHRRASRKHLRLACRWVWVGGVGGVGGGEGGGGLPAPSVGELLSGTCLCRLQRPAMFRKCRHCQGLPARLVLAAECVVANCSALSLPPLHRSPRAQRRHERCHHLHPAPLAALPPRRAAN